MNKRAGDSHIGGVVLADFRVAVRAVEHQRRADLAAVDNAFQGLIAFIVRTHKADLHQPTARFHLSIDNATAAFGGHGERLFTEHRFARFNRAERKRFMRRVPGGDNQRVHILRLNDILPVGIHFRFQAERVHRGARVIQIDVRYGNDGRALQNLGAATDMFFTNGACANYA